MESEGIQWKVDQRCTEFTYGNGLFGAFIRDCSDYCHGISMGHGELEQAYWVEELEVDGKKPLTAKKATKLSATKTAKAKSTTTATASKGKTSKTKTTTKAKTSSATTAKKAAPKRTRGKPTAKRIAKSAGKSKKAS